MKEKQTIKINISDITREATLSVVGYLDNKKMELPTEYAILSEEEYAELEDKFTNFLPLENILKMWQEKLQEVSFKGIVSKIDLIAILPQGVFHWEDVKIFKYLLKSGKSIHVVTVHNPIGEKYNRRRGIRIAIDRVMSIVQGENAYQVLVKDLSYCGVAIEEVNTTRLDANKAFVLMLTDKKADGEDYLVAKLTGRINNQKEKEDGTVVSGCILSADHAAELQRYIANKQIELIRGQRLGKELKKNVTGDNWQKKIIEQF
ncbi:PilZ domain-containing protein [Pseudobutyrivibrio ruminis]|uniref:PilZ domain-containing protein n=1 Tax=Pseudobutyrivibrio ruminis TaxID=46206 RepID=UPI0003F732A0|nr:PilZ domain-containing protein [Pseudobutyrivibrio ruminis]